MLLNERQTFALGGSYSACERHCFYLRLDTRSASSVPVRDAPGIESGLAAGLAAKSRRSFSSWIGHAGVSSISEAVLRSAILAPLRRPQRSWSLKASTEGMGLRTFPRSSQFAHSEFHVRFNSRPRLKRSLSHRCQQVVARHESGSRPQSFYCGICWRRYSFFFICRYSCSSNSCNWRWYCSVESNHDAKR